MASRPDVLRDDYFRNCASSLVSSFSQEEPNSVAQRVEVIRRAAVQYLREIGDAQARAADKFGSSKYKG